MAMVNMDNYEEYMMLYADKELNEAEEKALLAFVAKHPELGTELKAYTATQLQPDNAIVFGEKDTLLKKPAKRIALLYNWKFYATAACALLLFGTFFFQTDNTTTPHTPIAQKTETIAPVTPVEDTPVEQTQKKLYSKQPVKTIAMETEKAKPVSQPKEKFEEVVPHQQEELMVLNTLEGISDFEVRSQPITISEVAVPNFEKPVVEPMTDSKLVVSTPLNGASKGWKQIENIVNDKLVAAKQVKEKIEDTEVRFLIGKKELFTVRL